MATEGANLGNMYASIGLDTSALNRGASEARATLNRLDITMGALGARAIELGARMVAMAPAMIIGLVKSSIASITAQQDLANSLDVSIDGLRGLQLAAEEAGVSQEGLAKGISMMNARLGEAQRGSGEAGKALQNLGLSAAELAGMDIDERMATIADRVRELGLSSSETADFLRQFGIRGGEMVELFRQGGDAIRSARADVDAFGISLSAVDAKMVDNAEESLHRMSLTMEGIRNKVAVALAPILGTIADRFNEASKASGGFGNVAVDAVMGVGKGLALLGNVIHGVHLAFKGLEVAIASLGVVAAYVGKAAATIFQPALASSGVFNEAIDSAKLRLKELGKEFNEVATRKLPTEAWDEFAKEVKAKSEEIAKAQLDARKGGGGGGEYDPGNEELASKQEALRKQLDAVREYGMDELELLNKQLQDRMNLIREGIAIRAITEAEGSELVLATAQQFVKEEQELDQKRIDNAYALQEEKKVAAEKAYEMAREFALADEEAEVEEYERAAERVLQAIDDEVVTKEEGYARLEELETAHQGRLYQIREAGLRALSNVTISQFHQQAKFAAGFMADITSSVSRENKAMFEINKAAGIANALLHAKEAILGAYKVGAGIGGPYLGAAFAAVAAAATATQVAAIASQSYGSKGAAAPSLAGGTPAPPVTPVSGGSGPQQGGGRLVVQGIDPGAIFSGRSLRDLAEQLLEYQRDGGTVVFE